MYALQMNVQRGPLFPSIEERKSARQQYIAGDLYGAYPGPICFCLVMLAECIGRVSSFLPGSSYVLGLLMMSCDCDVRAAACRAMSYVRRPSRFSVRAMERCLDDPSGDVNRAVVDAIHCIGPKFVPLTAYLTMLLGRRGSSEEIGRVLAEAHLEGRRATLLEELDGLLLLSDHLNSDDEFLAAFLEELLSSTPAEVWLAIERLSREALPPAGDSKMESHMKERHRRYFAITTLGKVLVRYRDVPEYAEKFEAVVCELSLACLAETEEFILRALSLMLERIRTEDAN